MAKTGAVENNTNKVVNGKDSKQKSVLGSVVNQPSVQVKSNKEEHLADLLEPDDIKHF